MSVRQCAGWPSKRPFCACASPRVTTECKTRLSEGHGLDLHLKSTHVFLMVRLSLSYCGCLWTWFSYSKTWFVWYELTFLLLSHNTTASILPPFHPQVWQPWRYLRHMDMLCSAQRWTTNDFTLWSVCSKRSDRDTTAPPIHTFVAQQKLTQQRLSCIQAFTGQSPHATRRVLGCPRVSWG